MDKKNFTSISLQEEMQRSYLEYAMSNDYLKISQLKNAKTALEKGLTIEPNNHKAIFQ